MASMKNLNENSKRYNTVNPSNQIRNNNQHFKIKDKRENLVINKDSENKLSPEFSINQRTQAFTPMSTINKMQVLNANFE